jgi:GDP-4-dehydro-6-deoxy-D-mannose reductase
MKALITGINGFAGSHLARLLVKEGHEVHGTVRVRSDLHRIDDIKNLVTLHLVELEDAHSVIHIFERHDFAQVFHLAAQSYVKSSWDAPIETYHTTVDGTVNLLETIRNTNGWAKVFISSTSEVYGESGGPVDEETPCNPNTHYGISKLAQDLMGRMYAKSYGMPIVIGRSCNITGPGRASVFVDSNFARQIAEIEEGMREPVIKHGNLNSMRDFVDVRDVVRAYYKSIVFTPGTVFCFGTGKPTSIKSMLDILLSHSTVKNIKTEVDPQRNRPTDTQCIYSYALKAKQLLDWEPTIPLEQSLFDLLEYWRERV